MFIKLATSLENYSNWTKFTGNIKCGYAYKWLQLLNIWGTRTSSISAAFSSYLKFYKEALKSVNCLVSGKFFISVEQWTKRNRTLAQHTCEKKIEAPSGKRQESIVFTLRSIVVSKASDRNHGPLGKTKAPVPFLPSPLQQAPSHLFS